MKLGRTLLLAFCLVPLAVGATATAADSPELSTAKSLYGEKRMDEARVAFEALARKGPEQAEAEYHLGLIALDADDPKTAAVHFERAVGLAPGISEYHRRLGDACGMQAQRASVFSKLGLAKKCLRSYEKAVEVDPNNIGARWSAMEFYKQAPRIVGGSMEKAHAQADEIAKIDPGVGRWARALLLLKEEKPVEAIALYAGVADAEPSDYAALYQLGRICQWTGHELELGRKVLEKCLTLSPQPWSGGHGEVTYAIGRIRESQGDADAARVAYVAALELDPDFKPAQDALAKLN